MQLLLPLLALTAFAQANPVDQTALASEGPIHTTASWDYVVCGDESDPVRIQSIVVVPDPPKPGEELTVTVTAEVKEVIQEGAYADVTVKLGLIKLIHKQFDICEEARNANATVQCPIQPGPYVVKQTVELPKEIPQAKFTVNIRAYTDDDDDMACVDIKADFMKHPWYRAVD